jgi:tetratricopeptide (TPR) repeat protein
MASAAFAELRRRHIVGHSAKVAANAAEGRADDFAANESNSNTGEPVELRHRFAQARLLPRIFRARMNLPAAGPQILPAQLAVAPGAAPTLSALEREVEGIRGLVRSRRHAEALTAAEALASRAPDNRDALYLIASSLRSLKRIPAALATLERLEGMHPNFSRLYEERGHCYVALQDARRAIDAFRRAVDINPALPASWTALESLYRMARSTQNAATAAAQVKTLTAMPLDVLTAMSLFSDGESARAEHLIRTFLLTHRNHVEALHLLAVIGFERRAFDDAETLLEAALSLAPDYRAAHHSYAMVLIERHKYAQALDEIDKLLALEPKNRQFLALRATACVGLGEHEKAIACYRELLIETPRAPDLHLSIAHAQRALGRPQEAIASYRAAAAARPNYGDAYWSLANLKTYRFSDQEMARMQVEEAAPATSLVDRYNLCFALGKAYEDRCGYAQSWAYYERGNALKRGESRYRPELIETNARKQIETCTRKFFATRIGYGAQDHAPILIVGLPRSGSTLLEQILASHSRIEGTQELTDIQQIVLGLHGREDDLENPRYPGVLADMKPEEFLLLGEKYLRDTRAFRSGKQHFIDKMPNNFRHIGLIQLILPNARIIDVRREPMACCFSNLKQLFGNGQEFTYSIPDIARYYRSYVELMRHWDEALPGKILRVSYEDLVDNLEGNVRRILSFCRLEFEPSCVDFYKTERSVRTASSEQVRQPIFREGLEQWKHYEPWLGPLQDALGDALQDRR